MQEQPIDLPQSFSNQHGMRFRRLQAGDFIMGYDTILLSKDKSIRGHKVVISSPFYLAETPVTRQQWTSVMGTTPWDDDGPDTGTPEHPVTHVSYADAAEFCQRLTAESGLEYRLPTEAEWEYAGKAGSKHQYSFGDDDRQLEEYAWFKNNSGDGTHPVASKKPNPWGLYDMHGLVLEWCKDDWSYCQSEQPIDPININDDNRKAVKGGSWIASRYKCAAFIRYGIHGGWRLAHVGFRPAVISTNVEPMPRKRLRRRRLTAAAAR